jgi:hypothetical protein
MSKLVTFVPRSARAWAPPAGDAALVLVCRPALGGPAAAIVCADGAWAFPAADYRYAVRIFGLTHPAHPVRWVYKSWWPAAAAVKASFGVRATPTPASQAALATVRAAGARIEAFLIVNRCRGCVPGIAETNPLGYPEASTLELVHAVDCRAGGADG